jgi:hypothetical protein
MQNGNWLASTLSRFKVSSSGGVSVFWMILAARGCWTILAVGNAVSCELVELEVVAATTFGFI